MFQWKKLGQLFDPSTIKDRLWLHSFAQAPATLIFDDFVRIYFSCRPKPDENGRFVSYSAYIDVEKQNLFNILRVAKKPILSLGQRGCFDEFGTYPVSIIQKEDGLYAYYAGWTRCVSVPFNTAIGIAKSLDGGDTFQRLGSGPILSYSLEEPFLLSGPKIRFFMGKYYLFYVAGKAWALYNGTPEMSLKIRMAVSDDGFEWHKMNKNLISDLDCALESQASPDVFYKNGKFHMFFCHWDPKTYRVTKKRRISYAYSKDLIHWTRDDAKKGITVAKDIHAFDSEMVAYPHLFALDEEIYMLYLGNEVGRYGFGLAKLEGDLV